VSSEPAPIQRKWKALLKKLAAAHPAPPSTLHDPPAPVTVIAAAVHATMLWEASLAQADAKEALAKLGSEANFSPLEPFTAFLMVDFARWVKLTREANIRLDPQ